MRDQPLLASHRRLACVARCVCSPRAANILIAINPYKQLGVYGDEMLETYCGRPIGLAPPHLYAIADRAYRLCVVDRRDQSIVVSGESGAGKTESAKFVVQYLAQAARERSGQTGVDVVLLTERILNTTPLLEVCAARPAAGVRPPPCSILAAPPGAQAFGNARTLRNNNSSRFGKFLKIFFDAEHALVGLPRPSNHRSTPAAHRLRNPQEPA